MNTAEIEIGGAKRIISFPNKPDSVKYTSIIYGEIFKAEHYKKGLNCTNYHLAIGGANLTRYLSGMSLYFEGEQLAQATPTKTLEMFFKENKIKHIDLLKIDVEAAE